MLEVRTVKDDWVTLVSDDRQGENILVSDALSGSIFGDKWDETPMEDGEVRMDLENKVQRKAVAEMLAMAEDNGPFTAAINALDPEVGNG